MKSFGQLRALLGREKLDAEIAEEMEAHLEMQIAENEKRGMSTDEARYTAQLTFGSVERIKEVAREQRGLIWLEQTLQDFRAAARTLGKNFSFTAIVVLTLAALSDERLRRRRDRRRERFARGDRSARLLAPRAPRREGRSDDGAAVRMTKR